MDYSAKALNAFWQFAADRQAIFDKRRRGEPPPWTSDPVLSEHRFTNCYRAADRVSQWLIRNVLYNEQASRATTEYVFRALLFRMFNNINTYRALLAGLREHPSLSSFNSERYARIINQYAQSGGQVWGNAYMITPPKTIYGRGEGAKVYGWLSILDSMVRDGMMYRIPVMSSMEEVYAALRSYPTVGDFFAYQWTIDINYSPATDFNESDWAMPGPGAIRGANKLLAQSSDHRLHGTAVATRVIEHLYWEQYIMLGNRGIFPFTYLGGQRPLQFIDLQNLLCEFDKYTRVAMPELQQSGTYSRIKQRFDPSSAMGHEPIQYMFPPKWGLEGVW